MVFETILPIIKQIYVKLGGSASDVADDRTISPVLKKMIDHISPSGGSASKHNYSTDEQVIGTWIDGKPLYEKTFVTTTPNSTGGTLTDINLADLEVEEIINAFGYIQGNNHNKYFVNQYCYVSNAYSSSGIYRKIGDNIDELAMCVDANVRNNTMYLTLQYTKITDEAI